MSARSQAALVWWALAFAVIYGVALGFLVQMLPPPPATQSVDQIKEWYLERGGEIRLGATISGWTSGFLIPLFIVIGTQIARLEGRHRVWSQMAIIGGTLSSLFLVLPPLFFGVAAFSPDRTAEATAIMHQLGVLTLTTTDQFFVFAWVAIIVACLVLPQTADSPFPRWFGYYNIWVVVVFEIAPMAFLFRSGPLSWNGVFVFYFPFVVFGLWLPLMSWKLLSALKLQTSEAVKREPALAPA